MKELILNLLEPTMREFFALGIERAIKELAPPNDIHSGPCTGCDECNPPYRFAYLEAKLKDLAADVRAKARE